MTFRDHFIDSTPSNAQTSTDAAAPIVWIPKIQALLAEHPRHPPTQRDPRTLFVEATDTEFEQLWKQLLAENPVQRTGYCEVQFEGSQIGTQLYFPSIIEQGQNIDNIQLIKRVLETPLPREQGTPSDLVKYEELDIPEVPGKLIKRHIGKLVEASWDRSSENHDDASKFIRYSLDALASTDLVEKVAERVAHDYGQRIVVSLHDRLRQYVEKWPPSSMKKGIKDVETVLKVTIARILLLMYSCPANTPAIIDFTILEAIATLLWCLETHDQQTVELKIISKPQITISMLIISGNETISGNMPNNVRAPRSRLQRLGIAAWDTARSIGSYIKKHPIQIAFQIGVTLFLMSPMTVLGPILSWAGFGEKMTGLAVLWHSSMGTARAGTFLSMCQGMGATGRITATGAPLARGITSAAQVAGALVAAGLCGSGGKRTRPGEQGPAEGDYAVVLKISGVSEQ
ncbi:hypothetical protein BDZ91DRAFT_727488 [Kalaharituber pfeilii]|nr:hypothetical protein BDZ91DRAFT_727488 [Kalaharituber pfeilii]